jgi:hypothetical protein
VKKIAAILLIGVFFFNWFGYRLLTDLLQHKADKHLEAQLDRNEYDESQLIEMRVPLNMPYQTLSSGFERIDGEIEIEGIHYKYVKRKIEAGELVLLCLPNHSKMQLESARDEFFQLVNDLQNPSQNKDSSPAPAFKSPVTEYWQQKNDWDIMAAEGMSSQFVIVGDVMPQPPVLTTPAQPPEC